MRHLIIMIIKITQEMVGFTLRHLSVSDRTKNISCIIKTVRQREKFLVLVSLSKGLLT